MTGDRLCVYFAWPESPDLVRLTGTLGDAGSQVEFIVGPTYLDSCAVRTAKRSKVVGSEIVDDEPVLTPQHLEAYGRADVVVAVDVPHRLVELAPRLRWLQSCGAGVGQFNEPALE